MRMKSKICHYPIHPLSKRSASLFQCALHILFMALLLSSVARPVISYVSFIMILWVI